MARRPSMPNGLSDTMDAILRIAQDHPNISGQDLAAKVSAQIGSGADSVRNSIKRAVHQRYLHSDKSTEGYHPYLFSITGSGEMALMRTKPVKEDPPAAATQPAVSTNRAGPRNYVPTGLYTTDDRTAMRPGALDFKKLPSVYCGVKDDHPHLPPDRPMRGRSHRLY